MYRGSDSNPPCEEDVDRVIMINVLEISDA